MAGEIPKNSHPGAIHWSASPSLGAAPLSRFNRLPSESSGKKEERSASADHRRPGMLERVSSLFARKKKEKAGVPREKEHKSPDAPLFHRQPSSSGEPSFDALSRNWGASSKPAEEPLSFDQYLKNGPEEVVPNALSEIGEAGALNMEDESPDESPVAGKGSSIHLPQFPEIESGSLLKIHSPPGGLALGSLPNPFELAGDAARSLAQKGIALHPASSAQKSGRSQSVDLHAGQGAGVNAPSPSSTSLNKEGKRLQSKKENPGAESAASPVQPTKRESGKLKKPHEVLSHRSENGEGPPPVAKVGRSQSVDHAAGGPAISLALSGALSGKKEARPGSSGSVDLHAGRSAAVHSSSPRSGAAPVLRQQGLAIHPAAASPAHQSRVSNNPSRPPAPPKQRPGSMDLNAKRKGDDDFLQWALDPNSGPDLPPPVQKGDLKAKKEAPRSQSVDLSRKSPKSPMSGHFQFVPKGEGEKEEPDKEGAGLEKPKRPPPVSFRFPAGDDAKIPDMDDDIESVDGDGVPGTPRLSIAAADLHWDPAPPAEQEAALEEEEGEARYEEPEPVPHGLQLAQYQAKAEGFKKKNGVHQQIADLSLNELLRADPTNKLAFVALVNKCENPDYQIDSALSRQLQKLGLVDENQEPQYPDETKDFLHRFCSRNLTKFMTQTLPEKWVNWFLEKLVQACKNEWYDWKADHKRTTKKNRRAQVVLLMQKSDLMDSSKRLITAEMIRKIMLERGIFHEK